MVLKCDIKVLFIHWVVVPFLSVYWIHLIECILYLLILFPAHVIVLMIIMPLGSTTSQLEIKVNTWSKLINIYGVFRWLIYIRYIRCPRHKAIIRSLREWIHRHILILYLMPILDISLALASRVLRWTYLLTVLTLTINTAL